MKLIGSKNLALGSGLLMAASSLIAQPLARAADPAAPATAPATQSAESVLENLLHQPPSNPVTPTNTTSGPANPVVTPAGTAAAPNVPEAMRLREGQFVWNRIGRLVKDDKTDQWMLAFESDGKDMQDPPMTLLPSRLLMSMEQATDNGKRPIRFKVSGQVTEYHGKNYLLVTFMQTVRDLNQF